MTDRAVQSDVLSRTFKSEKVQTAYARLAPLYDVWSRLTESRATERAIEIAKIQNHEAVLEVAAGTGVALEQIMRRNPDGRNIGLDLSPGMLNQATTRLRHLPRGQCRLHIADAIRLPFKDNSFDLIVNNYMLDLLPEERFEPILLEFKRVLKRSGRVVIVTMASGTKTVHGFWRMLAKTVPALLTGCRPVSMRPYLEKTGFSRISAENVSQNTFPSEITKASL